MFINVKKKNNRKKNIYFSSVKSKYMGLIYDYIFLKY